MKMCQQDTRTEKPLPLGLPALVPGEFVRRDNRFRIQAAISGQSVTAHLPNSGRLGELLVRGRRIWLVPAPQQNNPKRRTFYDVALVEYQGRLVSVDARVPGRLVAGALRHRQLDGFESYTAIRQEVRLGASRLDFRLTDAPAAPPCWLEVKSVTLVEEGVARFPDAPTLRGKRHVYELIKAVSAGDRAAILFIVQRDDAVRFTPHHAADAQFSQALEQAAEAGVEVLAWRCTVRLQSIELDEKIPVDLQYNVVH